MDELDELRLKIAEAKGIHARVSDGDSRDYIAAAREYAEKGDLIMTFDTGADYVEDFLYDWPRSWDDVMTLESEIPEGQRYPYITALVHIVAPAGNFYKLTEIYWRLTHATPEQRCRAYLAWQEAVQQAAQP
jgi:hypothetical protein